MVAVAGIEARYSGWKSPLLALRDALRDDPQRVEDERGAWVRWLRDRDLRTKWLARVSVDDPRVGSIAVVEAAYEFPAPLPSVFGDAGEHDRDAPPTLSCEGARYWTTRNATVVGGWDVVTMRDAACWPALTTRVESILVSNALESRLVGWTPSFVIVRDDKSIVPRPTGRFRWRAGHRVDRAIALVGEHSFHYGHWLTDYLPRALAVRELPVSIPVLVDADVAPNSLWWLEKVLPDRPIAPLERGQSVDARELFVPLQRTFCPTGWIDSMELTPGLWATDPHAIAQIQRLATAGVAPTRRHRRLWLGRRGGHRPLANQEELVEAMSQHGFEPVYVEDLSMHEVQRLLDETRDIIAPIGSQLLNLLAAQGGLRVLALTGDSIERERAGLALYERCGHEVALVVGQQVGPNGRNPYEDAQRSFTVDRRLLEAACREFCGNAG